MSFDKNLTEDLFDTLLEHAFAEYNERELNACPSPSDLEDMYVFSPGFTKRMNAALWDYRAKKTAKAVMRYASRAPYLFALCLALAL